MSEIFDLNDWQEQQWLNTGGTRNKKIYLSPNGEEYFFKQSYNKGLKNYTYEFWSEIIASEIGKLCGLNMLQYDLAFRGDLVGCISKSMLINEKEGLVEGGRLIQSFDNTFNPDDRKLRSQYNFDLITNTFAAFHLEKYIPNIIDVIVFDALIGNSDRHQENWAIIVQNSSLSKPFDEIEKAITDSKSSWFEKWISSFYKDDKSKALKADIQLARLSLSKNHRFAPIYDSGCSFGRELTSDKVQSMLTDKLQFESYVNRGQSEIHWNQEKIGHFQLVRNLYKDERLRQRIVNLIQRISTGFTETHLHKIVDLMDRQLPEKFETSKIPEDRKELIVKLVTLRQKKLIEIIQ